MTPPLSETNPRPCFRCSWELWCMTLSHTSDCTKVCSVSCFLYFTFCGFWRWDLVDTCTLPGTPGTQWSISLLSSLRTRGIYSFGRTSWQLWESCHVMFHTVLHTLSRPLQHSAYLALLLGLPHYWVLLLCLTSLEWAQKNGPVGPPWPISQLYWMIWC